LARLRRVRMGPRVLFRLLTRWRSSWRRWNGRLVSSPVSSAQPSTAVSTVAMAEAARQMQLQARAKLLRDVATSWAALDFARISATWPGWVRLMTALLGRYHGQSAQQAALHYLAARQAATGVVGGFTPVLAPSPSPLWIERALGYAAPGTFERQTKAGASPDAASRSALTQVLGTSSRIALDGSRTTVGESVKADDKAVGWYRITDGDPCAFCALMASRGVVYKDEKTAGRNANRRFEGEGEFKFHNDCGCTSAPAFDREQPLPDLSREADRIYRSGNASLKDFRAAWANRPAS
jgi:hypothetical protein